MQGKFDVFPDNQNEQTTLKPLEKKIIKDFNCSEFIFCSDAGLGSANNWAFNSIGNRAYVIAHSHKKMKQEDRESTHDKLRALIKNTYRTLMTRGMKGCYVYVCDEELRNYIKQWI